MIETKTIMDNDGQYTVVVPPKKILQLSDRKAMERDGHSAILTAISFETVDWEDRVGGFGIVVLDGGTLTIRNDGGVLTVERP